MKKIKKYVREWNVKAELAQYNYITKIYIVILFSCVLINNIHTWFSRSSFATNWGSNISNLPLIKELFIYLLLISVNGLILYISLIPVLNVIRFEGLTDWESYMTKYSNLLQKFFHPENKRITYSTYKEDGERKNWGYWQFDEKKFSSQRPSFAIFNVGGLYLLGLLFIAFEMYSIDLYFNDSIEIATLLDEGKKVKYLDYFFGMEFESCYNYFLRSIFGEMGWFRSNHTPFERFCDFGWIVFFCQGAYTLFILPLRIKLSFKDDFNRIQYRLKEESSELRRSCYECGEQIMIWAKTCPNCNKKQKPF